MADSRLVPLRNAFISGGSVVPPCPAAATPVTITNPAGPAPTP